ncbi:MAG: PleD family two-component system response regulator [Muribaculaceae bacterium]
MGYNKTILIVDDKAIIAKMLMINLKEYNCVYQSNPLKGIKWLQDNDLPSLIITDLRMPSMSGKKFVKFLRQSSTYSNIPVIVLSSEDNSEEKRELFELGVKEYVVKPFNPQDVRARIVNLVG